MLSCTDWMMEMIEHNYINKCFRWMLECIKYILYSVEVYMYEYICIVVQDLTAIDVVVRFLGMQCSVMK